MGIVSIFRHMKSTLKMSPNRFQNNINKLYTQDKNQKKLFHRSLGFNLNTRRSFGNFRGNICQKLHKNRNFCHVIHSN